MKKILWLLCLALFLSGCCGTAVSSEPEKEPLRSYLGVTTDELIRIKGAPGAIAVLSTGEAVWTYKSQINGERERAAPDDASSLDASENMNWIETVSFIVDADGKIKSYSTAVEK